MKKVCFATGKGLMGIAFGAAMFLQVGAVANAADLNAEAEVSVEKSIDDVSEVSTNKLNEEIIKKVDDAVPEGETESEDDEQKRVTVSGNVTGYTRSDSFVLEFVSFDSGEDTVFSTVENGQYSAELLEDEFYTVYVPDAKDFCIYTVDNEPLRVSSYKSNNDIEIGMLDECTVEGEIYGFSDNADPDELYDLCDDMIVSFEKDGYYEEFSVDVFHYFETIPVGDYVITVKNRNGNVYMKEEHSFWYDVRNGYCDYDYVTTDTMYYSLDVSKGDYNKKGSETRMVCEFEGIEMPELSNASFWFVDADNNRTGSFSSCELNAGLAWLPKGKSYRIVASGLPDDIEIDYGSIEDIDLTGDQTGYEQYDYVVKFRSAVKTPLTIVKDTEDIIATIVGNKYTFRIEAEGSDLKYCWYSRKPGSDRFIKAGVYTNEYSRHITQNLNGLQAYCVITDSAGNKVVGRTATVTIEDKSPVITYPLGKELKVANLKQIKFSIEATSEEKLTYNWYCMIPETGDGDGKFHKAGCYSSTYTRTANKKRDGMQAYCVVTDASGRKVKSDTLTFKLK